MKILIWEMKWWKWLVHTRIIRDVRFTEHYIRPRTIILVPDNALCHGVTSSCCTSSIISSSHHIQTWTRVWCWVKQINWSHLTRDSDVFYQCLTPGQSEIGLFCFSKCTEEQSFNGKCCNISFQIHILCETIMIHHMFCLWVNKGWMDEN